MRGLLKVGTLFGCVLLLPAALFAQASITGTVKDSSGAVLPGVTVEAASPVLIEKTRSAVTDGSGNYTIVNLRPGVYSVTFTLTGFSTVKRDNVTLAGSGQTAVDATMRVGAVAETITVTGETPIVDVTSTTKEAVLDHDTVQTLPTSRQYFSLARLVPGTNSDSTDVGGSRIAQVGNGVTIHGSRNVDERITLNGLSIMTLQAGGFLGGQQPDVGSAAEITIETSSLSAEMSTGGVRINFIPRDGGNTFSNSTFFSFSNQSMQGSNFTDALKAAGLATPNAIDKNYDLNESVGGPILRDKVWFYFSTRFNRANTFAGIFANKNAFNPDPSLQYVPDTNNPAANKGWVQQNNLRVTWQASSKVKIAGTQKVDQWCACPNGVSAQTSPEAAADFRFPRLRQEHAELTSPVTNKFLVEVVGMHLFERWGNMDLRVDHGSLDNSAQENAMPLMISAREQSTGLTFRSRGFYNNTRVPNYTYRVAASYVTGSHSFKAGWNDTFGYLNMTTYAFQPLQYQFNHGAPTAITEYATPYTAISDQNHDLGVFAQDQWKLNRVTLNGALRYDWFKTSFPAQHLGAGQLLPNRSIDFPFRDNLGWKDVTYRSGVAWDVRGDGKTAVKAAFNKYLLGQTLNALGSSPNPVNALVTQATRSWGDANGNFIPDCVLTNVAANGECGPLAPSAFGTTVPGATFDSDLLTGYGHRPANWEFTAGVQQEILPRISVEVSYFRRIWNNFQVTDNLLAAASDFTPFNMVVPVDSRLPGGGGYTLSYFDVNPAKFGQVQNFNTLSDKYGTQTEHWDGLDINVNGRLQNGLAFQAGISTGRDTSDNCAVVAKLPELLALEDNSGFGPPNGQVPTQFCHLQEPMLTQFKTYGSYMIPKVDVQVAASFRSVPGVTNGGSGNISGMRANFVADNAYLATNSTLGRPLSGNARNTTLEIVNPDTIYLDRDNELDLRIGKVFLFKKTRSTVNLDLYNALNANTILTANTNFARWLAPTSITNARLAKITLTFDLK